MADLAGTGLPIIDWDEIFHVGVRVPDLEKAQRELTKMTRVHWATPARLPMNVWDPRACTLQIRGSEEPCAGGYRLLGASHVKFGTGYH